MAHYLDKGGILRKNLMLGPPFCTNQWPKKQHDLFK